MKLCLTGYLSHGQTGRMLIKIIVVSGVFRFVHLNNKSYKNTLFEISKSQDALIHVNFDIIASS